MPSVPPSEAHRAACAACTCSQKLFRMSNLEEKELKLLDGVSGVLKPVRTPHVWGAGPWTLNPHALMQRRCWVRQWWAGADVRRHDGCGRRGG